jgi:arginyl-tRNA synthetase
MHYIKDKIIAAINELTANKPFVSNNKVIIELPKNPEHGCLATNAALVLSKAFKTSPLQLAERLQELFLAKTQTKDIFWQEVQEINIVKPGFINFIFTNKFWQNQLADMVQNKDNFFKTKLPEQELENNNINIEFGSPNPTGPLHLGHSRGAIYGDILANILKFAGYKVTKENYVNDAGNQINILGESLFFRYKEIINNDNKPIDQNLYPGEYLILIAQKIVQEHGNKFITEENYLEFFKKTAITEILLLIKQDFAKLGVKHDLYFSEKEQLHDTDLITKTVDILQKQDKIYMGILPKPKGKETEDWQETEQLLFKSSQYGDDIDRVIQKNDQSWTYFAADAAYHYNKISRGFNKMILVLGADHGGYIKRMKALVKALSDDKAEIDIKICQLVKFIENGQNVKMSKRSGNFITIDEVIDKVGSDALRFIMMTRKNDASLDFDLDKAVEQSKDNPIFYVQYAHARICSILRSNDISIDNNISCLSNLTHKIELNIIKHLCLFPQIITNIARNYEVHLLSFYMLELASLLHSYWHLGNIDKNMRLINQDKNISKARITLAIMVKKTLAQSLALFNIAGLEEMK